MLHYGHGLLKRIGIVSNQTARREKDQPLLSGEVTHLTPDVRAKEGIVTMVAKPTYEDLEQRIRLLEEESIRSERRSAAGR